MKLLLSAVLLVLSFVFAVVNSPGAPPVDAELISITVEAAIQKLSLRIGEGFVIDEPPGVPCGIEGTAPNGDLVELYIGRGTVPFSERRDWKLEQFLSEKVLGVARQHEGKWTAHGQVMVIRSMGIMTQTGEGEPAPTEQPRQPDAR